MNHESCSQDKTFLSYKCRRCVSWSAIVAGGLVAIGLSFLFNLFNAGIGLTGFSLDQTNIGSFTIGVYIWLVICGIISMFITGWVAGRLSSFYYLNRKLGLLHGFLAWCLGLVFMIILASHISMIVAASTHYIPTRTVSTTVAQQPTTATTPKEAAMTASKTTLAVFFIFLVGAASSCAGGYFGTYPHRKIETTEI